jgi:signal transduction histidine kinase
MKKQHIILLDFLFIFILAFLLGFSYLSYQRIEKLKITSDWVNHSSLVKLGIQRSLGNVVDAESGQRGYLLTHDSTFYQQYREALPRVREEIGKVLVLIRDNSHQHTEMQKLVGIVNLRLRILDSVLRYEKNHPEDKTGIAALLKRGKMVRDSSRILSRSIIAAEDKILAERTLEKQNIGSLTPVVVLVFSVLAILFVVFAWLKMRTETSLRLDAQISEATSRRLQQESAELNQLLETKVNERTEELQRQNVSLEMMNDELMSFNYVASHDLQEPLRKIQAFSGRIMDSEEEFSSTTKDYFSRITSAASRMQNLLEALISYSRANSTQQDFENINLNKLLDEVKSDIRELIEEKKAMITSADLPTLNVIPTQFHQLFLNLISNAIKYSRPNVLPKINITSQLVNVEDIKKPVYLHHQKYWKLTFEDNGIGFESQYEDKIFELFQRLHGKNEFEGTGIGLAICKKIVQNHNGYIFAEGQPDQGARFFIYFPA